MTPAEKVAASKRRQRPKTKARVVRKAVLTTKVRDVRESLRLSLRDVADAVGLSTTALWQLERGLDCMLTTAIKLAAFYGKTINELWTPVSGEVDAL